MRSTLALAVLLLVSCNAERAVVIGDGSSDLAPASPDAPAPVGSVSAGSDEDDTLTCWAAPLRVADGAISFEDTTTQAGLVEPLLGMHGHAAAFGDVDGDQLLDLLVGTFADRTIDRYQERGAEGPSPDRLLYGGDGFAMREDSLATLGRTSGAVFGDLDGDGDSDLLLIRHARLEREAVAPSVILENRHGTLHAGVELLPVGYLGRTGAVADFDRDGLLDIYVSEDRYGDTGGLLFHNQGGLTFADVTSESGLAGVFSLGATAADLNGDGWPDLVTSDRVFIGEEGLRFIDVTPPGFGWSQISPDDDPAGVAVGDVDNDGLPDIVVGQHYRSTVDRDARVPIRLFRHLGVENGRPSFEEITESAGLTPLPTLAPHVELADIDNDGYLDIVTSASAFEGEGPAVFRNEGTVPVSFETPPGLGSPQYWVGAPVGDTDRDGRLDVFAVEWEPGRPSRLFRNATPAGHWLEVSISGPSQGVGTIIEVESGGHYLGRREVSVSGGYASAGAPYAHFGVGDHSSVTVRITVRGEGSAVLEDVPVDRHIRWPDGC